MSAESDITAALSEHAQFNYPYVSQAVAGVTNAISSLRVAQDLLDVIRAVDQLSLAMEALEQTAGIAHKAADAALLKALVEAGAPTMRVNGHLLGTRTNAPSIDIEDPAAVPAAYLIARDPIPDRPKIRALLNASASSVNWARFGVPTVSLTRRAAT